jgi:membrane peptidoglycan carboxypeptidase
MGYDDNTPLTGVTGGGLPAEIWRETMLRLHRGLAPRPLGGGTPVDDQIARAAQGVDDVARSVLTDVIGFLSRGLGGGSAAPEAPRGTWER